jgi:hypothetical protein
MSRPMTWSKGKKSQRHSWIIQTRDEGTTCEYFSPWETLARSIGTRDTTQRGGWQTDWLAHGNVLRLCRTERPAGLPAAPSTTGSSSISRSLT